MLKFGFPSQITSLRSKKHSLALGLLNAKTKSFISRAIFYTSKVNTLFFTSKNFLFSMAKKTPLLMKTRHVEIQS